VSHAAQRTAFVFAVPAADARRLTGPSSIISAKVETAPAPADVVRRGAGRSEHGLKSIIPAAVRSEQGIKRTPQRSCLNLLPSRATPYLAPAAGTIITATPLARASRQRRWSTLGARCPSEFRRRRRILDVPVDHQARVCGEESRLTLCVATI
jgi:hypothetical protein